MRGCFNQRLTLLRVHPCEGSEVIQPLGPGNGVGRAVRLPVRLPVSHGSPVKLPSKARLPGNLIWHGFLITFP